MYVPEEQHKLGFVSRNLIMAIGTSVMNFQFVTIRITLVQNKTLCKDASRYSQTEMYAYPRYQSTEKPRKLCTRGVRKVGIIV